MRTTFTLVCILISVVSIVKSVEFGSILYVSSPNDIKNCEQRYSNCHTLEEYSSKYKSYITSNSILKFLSGNHPLNTAIEIRGEKSIQFSGKGESVTVICTDFAGFIFSETSDITITGLKFIGCGAIDVNTNITAALIFINGSTLTLTDIVILKAIDAGIVSNDIQGTTNISNISISSTRVISHSTQGNKISYNNCLLNQKMNFKLIFQYSFIFDNPCARSNDSKQMSGLKVFVERCFAEINITNVHFNNNCGSHYGGNLAVFLENITNISGMKFLLSNSKIENGKALGGGGAYITISRFTRTVMTQSQIPSQNRVIFIKNTAFLSNSGGILGGGLYIQHKNFIQDVSDHSVILIENCTFHGNYLIKAQEGGVAIHSNSYILAGYLIQVRPQYKIIVKECCFQNNKVNGTNINVSGNSVIFVNSNDYFGIENVLITKNNISGIIAVSSNLVFSKSTTISFNKGSSGGGLLLCQKSIMYLTSHTNMYIYGNSVTHAGGGICIEPECLQSKPMCFFQFDNKTQINSSLIHTIKIHIHDNDAHYSGENLFGGDVDICFMLDNPLRNRPTIRNSKYIYKTIFNISNGSSSVSSRPRHVCFCIDHKIDYSVNSFNITTYPGQTFRIPVVLVGQENGIVPGVVQTWVNDETAILTNTVQNISKTCSDLIYTIEVRHSNSSNLPKSIFLDIGVQHTGDQSGYERLRTFKKRRLIVKLKDCPIGLTLSSDDDSNKTCNHCDSRLQCKNIKCFVDDNKVYIQRKQSRCWVNYAISDNGTSIQSSDICPFDYCIENEINLTMTNSNDEICANNRSGILCGHCRHNFSEMLGSSTCGKCTNKYLAMLLVFALAGLLLVLFLTVFNLTIAEGTLSGLIFYANVIECNAAFIVPHKNYNKFPTPVFRVFIAWINLDLGIETCLYDGMDAYSEAWLQFIFPIYIWLIAITIIILSNRYQLIATMAGRNAVKVLATLVLLSYANFCHTIISTFAFTQVDTLFENNTITTEIVWAVDANIKYFSKKHALLLCGAVISGLLTMPFAIILLLIKPLQQFSHRKPFKFIQTLKPFIDAYTGPYTDNGRFWPGLLIVVRIGLSIIGGRTSTNFRTVVGVTTLAVIFLLGMAAQIRPGLHRKRALDALECFFLINLSLLFLGTAYYSYTEDSIYEKQTIFNIFVGSAFFTFIGIILYHAWLKVQRYQCSIYIVTRLRIKINEVFRLNRGLESTQRMNNYPPFFRFTEEREPLLADHED